MFLSRMFDSRMMLRFVTTLVVLAIAACAASPDEPMPAEVMPEPGAPADVEVAKIQRYLECDRRSTGKLAESNRMEACRLLADFEQGATFDRWPATGDETWFGRWYDCPHPQAEAISRGPFMVVRLKIGSFDLGPEALRLLPIKSVLPYSVRSLVLSTEPSSQDQRSYEQLVDALAHDRRPSSPQLARQLKESNFLPGGRGRLSSPSAVARTRGVSVQFYDVAGRDPVVRRARDADRMLMVSGGSAFELWRIP